MSLSAVLTKKIMKVLLKGYAFGMMLQMAVGPMCLFVFNTAADNGFTAGFSAALAVALMDMVYIILSGVSAQSLLKKDKFRGALKLIGAFILIFFGINMIISVKGVSLIPGISIFKNSSAESNFLKGLIMTASNPLTIIFWSGVFSAQVTENNYSQKQLFAFGSGCVLSTLSFMTCTALLGTLVSWFLDSTVIQILNICVGAAVIFFGLRMLFKRTNEKG